jgi:hypothetical protein
MKATIDGKKPRIPLFERFTVEQLTELIPYSERYLRDLRDGDQPIRPRFRRIASRILGQSEADLFDSEPAEVAS